MQNKTPQGKPDPIPTPEHDLERYGVWVKAEPQDLNDDAIADAESASAPSADGSDAVLLAEEEELLDSFDLPDLDTAVESVEEASAVMDFDDFESLAPLDDMADASGDRLDDGVVESTVIDMSLDDLDFDEVKAEEPEAPRTPTEDSTASAESFETTEISIEDFGLDDETPAGPALEDIDRFSASAETAAEPSGADEEFESLDIDLQFDDTIPSAESEESADAFSSDDELLDVTSEFESVDLDSIGVDEPKSKPAPAAAPRESAAPEPADESEGISLDSFIDSDDDSSIGIIPDLEIESVSIGAGDSGFDDVRAVSDDLSASAPSSDLLKQIASELSSIKQELVSLRDQLSSIKSTGAAAAEAPDEAGVEEPADAAGGFFDDEDDDTIALTGDELDNILNTADFTEETVSEEPDESEAPEVCVPDDIELLPEDGVYDEAVKPGIETIELDEDVPAAEAVEPLEGVTPLTSEPEDTSFLDEEAEPQAFEELEGMPIEDVPLVEPSDSDLDIDIAPAFEGDDEDLPIIEAADEESELVLDIDADETPVVSTVDAFDEPIDEVDDAMDLEELVEPDELGGLELHAESPSETVEELLPSDDDLEELSLDDFDNDQVIDKAIEAPEAADEAGIDSPQAIDISYHPDEIATSLDDSLFVDSSKDDTEDAFELVEEVPLAEEEAHAADEALADDEATVEELATDEYDEPAPEPTPESEPIASPASAGPARAATPEPTTDSAPDKLKRDVKSVLVYLDQLLASLPEEKIEEFASSEYYDTYKRLFDDLGLL